MRMLLLIAVVWSLSLARSLAAEPADAATVIPLGDIWALDMPGTKNLRELDSPEDPIVTEVLKNLAEQRQFHHPYAVRGEGKEALREFLRVRANPENWYVLPADEPVTLVYFTSPMRADIVLDRVVRTGLRFHLYTRFAPDNSADASPQLALIPVGKLAADHYSITPERVPPQVEHLAAGFERPPGKVWADVFAGSGFRVVHDVDAYLDDTPVEIPVDTIWGYGIPGTRDLREIPTGNAAAPTVDKLLFAIRESWEYGEGMAVQGEGPQALKSFASERLGKREMSVVRADASVSLAFYTSPVGWRIQLEKVVRRRNRFTIQYRPIPYREAESASCLALIPVGELWQGKYHVTVEQLPIDEKYVEQGFRPPSPALREKISNSFTLR